MKVVKGYRHTGIICKDINSSLIFYRDYLGLTVIQDFWDDSDYINEITIFKDNKTTNGEINNNEKDELYFKALEVVKLEKKASTSFLQRKLQIGYNRAARIIEMMEKEGIVSPANHVGKREIL